MEIHLQTLLSSLLLAIVSIFEPEDDTQHDFIILVNHVKRAQEDRLGIYINFPPL